MFKRRRQLKEAVRLLRYALTIRMYGERAPGGNENWRQFDNDVEDFLNDYDGITPE